MHPVPPAGGDRSEPVGEPLSFDDTLEILADRRRRLVLEFCVSVSGQTVELDDLVEYLSERGEQSSDELGRDQLRLSLHHVHLPMLAAKSVVEFDRRSGQLRYIPDERLERWLKRIKAAETGDE